MTFLNWSLSAINHPLSVCILFTIKKHFIIILYYYIIFLNEKLYHGLFSFFYLNSTDVLKNNIWKFHLSEKEKIQYHRHNILLYRNFFKRWTQFYLVHSFWLKQNIGLFTAAVWPINKLVLEDFTKFFAQIGILTFQCQI